MYKTGLMLFLGLALLSCGESSVKPDQAKARKVVKSSAKSTPDWIVMQKKHSDFVYFVGMSTEKNDLKASRDQAIDDAVSQLVEYIGFRVTARLQKSTEYTDTDQASAFTETIMQSIDGKGSAQVSVDVEDFYYEQYSDETISMYVLLKLPKKWVEEERARLKLLALEQRGQALAFLADAQKAKKQGELAVALEDSLSAYYIAEQASENADVYDQAKNEIRSILSGINLRLDSQPKFAYTEGGSDAIQFTVVGAGSSRGVGGLLTAAWEEAEKAKVISQIGFSSDAQGRVTLEVGSVQNSSVTEIRIRVGFSTAKMDKIKNLDPEFYQEILKMRDNMGLSLVLKVGPRDKFVPTAVIILSVVRMNNKLVKPQLRPDVYDRIAGLLANRGYNIVAAEIPQDILIEAREEKVLKELIIAHLKEKYPTTRRMFFGIEVITSAGKDVAMKDTESAQININMSLIDISNNKLEKSVDAVGRMWGNTFQQAVKEAEKKAYKKLLEELESF